MVVEAYKNNMLERHQAGAIALISKAQIQDFHNLHHLVLLPGWDQAILEEQQEGKGVTRPTTLLNNKQNK